MTALLFSLVVVTGLCSSMHAQAQLTVTAVESGLFSSSTPGQQLSSALLSNASESIRATEKIPAELGVKFGLRYSVGGKAADGSVVKLLYLTPGVIDSNGRRRDKYEVTKNLSPEVKHHTMAFEFAEPGEIARGIWQMMVFEEDRLLIKRSFRVGDIDITPISGDTGNPDTIERPSIQQFKAVKPD